MRLFLSAALVGASCNVGVAQGLTPADEQIRTDAQNAHDWQELICVPRARLVCAGATCEAAVPTVQLRLTRESPIRGIMRRCDLSCDNYEVSIYTAGIFTSLQPIRPSGSFVKIQGAREFVEVVTLGLGVYYSLGSCSRVR